MRPIHGLTRWASGIAFAFAGLSSWAQTPAGQIMVAAGAVQVVDARGERRSVNRGETLHTGERVVTGTGGLVQIKTVDGGYISVRPESEMVVESVKFAAETPKESSFVIGLIKGGFRSITGAIGKANPDGYEIRTQTATIGIRGTDHEPMFIPPDAAKLPGAPLPGIYDKVNTGETFIRNELGLLAIKPGQIGFSPAVPKVAPEFVRVVPAFYREEVKMVIPPGEGAAAPDAPPVADVGKLRPRIGAVRTLTPRVSDALNTGATTTPLAPASTLASPTLSTTTLEPLTATVSPTLSTSTISPTLSTSTLSTSTLSTTALQPLTTTLSPTISTTTLQPLTTTISPTLSTTTISPTISTTTLQPLTTTISPTLSTTKSLILK